jgi:uncharacterized protein YceK
MNLMSAIIFCVALLVVSGCTNIRRLTMPDDQNILSGAGSLMTKKLRGRKSSTDGFEQIDLDCLLKDYKLSNLDTISDAVAVPSSVEKYRYLRNELQERLITASNQRCSAYIRMIVSSKSQTQIGWGGLAGLLSGAASVVSNVQMAKVFAAGSTVSTGLLSAYNEAYFNNLAINVVSAGISKQRESILSSISLYQDKPLPDYPVNAAIADALAYHAACNIVSGMEAAAKAATEADAAKFSPLSRDAKGAEPKTAEQMAAELKIAEQREDDKIAADLVAAEKRVADLTEAKAKAKAAKAKSDSAVARVVRTEILF